MFCRFHDPFLRGLYLFLTFICVFIVCAHTCVSIHVEGNVCVCGNRTQVVRLTGGLLYLMSHADRPQPSTSVLEHSPESSQKDASFLEGEGAHVSPQTEGS